MKLVRILALAAVVLASPALCSAGDNVYLAVGPGGHRMIAKDGLKWENHAALGEPKHDQNDLNVATMYHGMAIVGGGYSSGRVMATRDGKTWSDGVLPRSSPIFGVEILDDTLYLVGLHGELFATHDGENYELLGRAAMPTRTHWIRATASGNGLIVGSGDFGPAMVFNPKTKEIAVTQMAGQTIKNAGFYRVAFGNGIFVVCGQDGLIASSRDGKTWENNVTVPERGDVTAVVWAGDHFLANTTKGGALVSKDGVNWEKQSQPVPRLLVRADDWVYGWSQATKLQRSHDGVNWEPVPNEMNYHVKDVAFGQLAGSGDPPKLPVPPAAKAKQQ
jgi:hypothetical protein